MKFESIREITHELQAVEFGVSRALSRYELTDMEPSISLEVHQRIGGELVYQLRAFLYGTKHNGQEIRFPATWWDAFKLRWFPRWALRRWPPVWTIYQAQEQNLYPDIKIVPGQRTLRLHEFIPVEVNRT